MLSLLAAVRLWLGLVFVKCKPILAVSAIFGVIIHTFDGLCLHMVPLRLRMRLRLIIKEKAIQKQEQKA